MPRICGAGVLPYFVENGEFMFVLGKERYVPGWKGSSKLSAFEGGHKGGETLIENATREFVEESLGVFLDPRSLHRSMSTLKQELSDGSYSMKIGIHSFKDVHWTFVKRFEIKKDVVRRFEKCRSNLVEIQRLQEQLISLISELPEMYPFIFKGDMVQFQNELCVVNRVVLNTGESSEYVSTDLLVHPGKIKRLTFKNSDTAQKYIKALGIMHHIDFLVESNGELSLVQLSTKHKKVGGRSVQVVSNDWLEKSSIHAYSLKELHIMLLQNASSFRPYFSIVLKNTLEHFIDPPSPGACISRST